MKFMFSRVIIRAVYWRHPSTGYHKGIITMVLITMVLYFYARVALQILFINEPKAR